MSDIHANLPALQAAMKDAESCGADELLCLGDVVGNYDQPAECVRIMRDKARMCLKGNHDVYCSASVSLDSFNQQAREHVEWTRVQLSEEDREWLANLPLTVVVDGFTLVHATLNAPHRWEYVADKLSAAASFAHQKTKLCFFGHTHLPLAFMRDSSVRGGTYSKLKIDSEKDYFINVGSVGQSRDGDWRATYAVYDAGSRLVELRRVDYDRPTRGPSGGDDLGKPVSPKNPPPNTLTGRNEPHSSN
jgi:diadenosine tetraphosphatase ApaH/serine/threonine PP2A family protein phosphatase